MIIFLFFRIEIEKIQLYNQQLKSEMMALNNDLQAVMVIY